MKFVVIIALFFVYANAIDPKIVQEFVEQVTKFGEKCMEETKATTEDVAQLIAHQSPSTHEGKCMISCVYKAFGIQNEDGTINQEEGLKLASKIKESDPEVYEKMETISNKCQDIPVDEDHCITALNLASCYIKEAKAIGLTAEMFGM
uniref:Odorant-binding protein 14 n=1 Tax=Pyrrhalta maculicollis TaxID=226885 RepID=A0A1J0KKF6_9CUCU|nr:odorant-binding protein 14 [Pyrrhalta maculicollis]